jgi:hypothetical protein
MSSSGSSPPNWHEKLWSFFRKGYLLLPLNLAGPGCAYTYVDKAGATHIVGLTSVTIPPQNCEASEGGRGVRVTTIGVSLVRSEVWSAVSVGYNSEELFVLRNNACVRIVTPRASGEAQVPTRQERE